MQINRQMITLMWVAALVAPHFQHASSQLQPLANRILEEDEGVNSKPPSLTEQDLEKFNQDSNKGYFQAEVNRLIEIILHSLYTNRKIFLRELISNAGDALDKIRYQSLLDPNALGDTKDLEIMIRADPENKTISIRDSGIGMTRDELVQNLGTVARSGTAKFLETIAKTKDESSRQDQIGQFGVGFYSAFLVAEHVTVVSKSNEDDQHIWRSKADGAFEVAKDPRGNTLGRGTEILLKMKEDSEEFLETTEIEAVVKKYSEFVQYPIKQWKLTQKTVEIEEPEEEEEESDDDMDDDEDDELMAADDEEDDKKSKTVEKTVWDWETMNDNKPIWTRRPSDVKDEEYKEFYKVFDKDSEEPPISWTHFRTEGEIEFDSLLFIPKKAPFGLYDNYYTTDSSLKLYVRRILVADEWKEFIPRYLNFIRGLVDSNDLPLNVNREQLQKNKIMKVISKKVTRKALDMLRKLAEESEPNEDGDDDDEESDDDDEESEEKPASKVNKYNAFWKEFGKSIKLGIIEDSKNRKKLLNLLRFKSTKSENEYISLQSYVDRMKEGQKNIFYITAASQEEARKSPTTERLTKQGYEVLYFVENLDEYMNLTSYDDYQFQSVTKDGLELAPSKNEKQYFEGKAEEFEELCNWLEATCGNKVTKVQISQRQESTPMAIVTSKFGVSANMERLSKGQVFGSDGQTATKILEINFRHPIIQQLKKKMKDTPNDQTLIDLAQLLYDSAVVSSGFAIDGNSVDKFKERVDRIVRRGVGVDENAKVDPLPEFSPDTDDDDEEEEEEEEGDSDDEEEEGDSDDEEEENEGYSDDEDEEKDELLL